MERIAGVNVPEHEHVRIGLRRIYGIGNSRALEICTRTSISPEEKMGSLSAEQLNALREAIANYVVEGDLRREISMNIKRLKDLQTYRGLRHRRQLPVRGQRTKTNAKTCKKRKRG